MSIETKKYRELGDFIFLKSTFEEINLEDILTFTTPKHRWLSNMTYVDIVYDEITYPSTENFYQAMKYQDKEIRAYVATLKPRLPEPVNVALILSSVTYVPAFTKPDVTTAVFDPPNVGADPTVLI